ncbi:hypothetical protein ACFL0V_02190 [Nanoarchaeota archaeon]
MNWTKLFPLLAVIMLPAVFSFDCSLTLDSDYCSEVLDDDMPIEEKHQLLSSLLYPYNLFPNHNVTQSYNLNITVDEPPENTTIYNSREIRNAWFSFLAVFPSVYENGTLYVPPTTNTLCWHDHDVVIPQNYRSGGYPSTKNGDCKTYYSLIKDDAEVTSYVNNILRGTGNYTEISVNSDGEINTRLDVDTTVRVRHYTWQRVCCKRWKNGACRSHCYKCKYSHTTYLRDHVGIGESKDVKLFDYSPEFSLALTDEYYNTTKGNFSASNHSYFQISFKDSNYSEQKYYYDIVFEKLPYYYAFLEAHPFNFTIKKNIHINNKTFFVGNKENCSLYAYNHFFNKTEECNLTVIPQNVTRLEIEEKESDLDLLIMFIVVLLVMYALYKLITSQFRKVAIPILLLVLILPPTLAVEECGITNLASCIPEKLYEFFLSVINAPLQPFLTSIEYLLTADVHVDIFHHVWSVVRYILSFFYVFLFAYAGIIFVTNNANPIRRSQAKEMLRDYIIMIILIQGSFYLYELIVHISSILSSAIYGMVDPHFFMLTADNITNIGLQMIFTGSYVIVLFLSVMMLALRYMVVSMGIIMVPIAIFCYFIPPLKAYGKFMINVLGIFIFITFFDMLIILASSMIVQSNLFEHFKIIVMINCFSIVNYTLYLGIKFALKKSANASVKDDVMQAAKYIALAA